jgi:hypothetical protein
LEEDLVEPLEPEEALEEEGLEEQLQQTYLVELEEQQHLEETVDRQIKGVPHLLLFNATLISKFAN